ncbi:hypothetical protein [Deinococcus sp. NW-56]|uniref:hypothetical protein n=1 Tax=Deinococcus sp. NW-56 TaxID=2080419 RepID=UPI000CF3D156|nr:hypothetical protein [Deinococcus sp. NW-56]
MTDAAPAPWLIALLRELYPRRLPRLPLVTVRLWVAAVQMDPVSREHEGQPDTPDGWGELFIGEVFELVPQVYADRPGQRALPHWRWV